MHYGVIIPDIVDAGPQDLAALARDAEDAGWDAIFFWDGDWGLSPWVVLSAMAMQTSRIRFGAILHPLPWRQAWLFARDAATLDQLSGGRLIVALGLGAVDEEDWARGRTRFGAPVDRRLRAELLDEGLAVTTRLWQGGPVTFRGKHYQLEEFALRPRPVQSPRIPLWVVGVWGRQKSMERVLRCDGMLVDQGLQLADLQAIRSFAAEGRAPALPFDIVMEADTRGDAPEQAREKVRGWAEAGVTWWLETMWSPPSTFIATRERIRQGPPR